MPALIRASILLAAALMASAASGQENAAPDLDALLARVADARTEQQLSRMMAEIDALPPMPDLLPRLLEANPNAYVYALQSGLRAAGYASPLSGILGRSTVSQLSAFCADKGIDAQCRLGPLLPDIARAIGAALAAGNDAAPAAEPAAPAAPAQAEPLAAAPAAEAGLPAGWSIDDGQVFGLTTSIADASATGATIRIEGTPRRNGWLNVRLSPPVDAATAERWTVTVGAASATGQADTGQTIRLLVALLRADGGYMGELFEGIALPMTPAPLEGSGAVPADVALLQPYMQVRFTAGSPLAVAVALDAPALAPDD